MKITDWPKVVRNLFLLQIAAVFAISAILALAPEARAKLIVKEQTRHYNIWGKTGRQIHAKLGRRGPWRIRKKHAIAATVRTFEFKNIKFTERGKKCVLTNIDIHLTLTYYFPKWINKNNGSKKLQKLWGVFSRELVRHERVHGKYFKDTMRQFEKELLRTTGRLSDNCSGMLRSAKARLDKIEARGDLRHAAFDRREKKPTAKIRKLEKAIVRTK